jgi:hypothetical protein
VELVVWYLLGLILKHSILQELGNGKIPVLYIVSPTNLTKASARPILATPRNFRQMSRTWSIGSFYSQVCEEYDKWKDLFEQIGYNKTPEERLNVQIKRSLVFSEVWRVHESVKVDHTNKFKVNFNGLSRHPVLHLHHIIAFSTFILYNLNSW